MQWNETKLAVHYLLILSVIFGSFTSLLWLFTFLLTSLSARRKNKNFFKSRARVRVLKYQYVRMKSESCSSSLLMLLPALPCVVVSWCWIIALYSGNDSSRQLLLSTCNFYHACHLGGHPDSAPSWIAFPLMPLRCAWRDSNSNEITFSLNQMRTYTHFLEWLISFLTTEITRPICRQNFRIDFIITAYNDWHALQREASVNKSLLSLK